MNLLIEANLHLQKELQSCREILDKALGVINGINAPIVTDFKFYYENGVPCCPRWVVNGKVYKTRPTFLKHVD